MDYLSYIITVHELAKVDASHSITVSAHTTLGTSPIVDFGTPEQQRRFVPLLAGGKVLGGFGLTEPGAGSDAGGTATTAVDKGDHYLLNGSKIFITHAGVGEIFVCTARTTPGSTNRGITAFIVTKETCDKAQALAVGIGHERVAGVDAGGPGRQEGGQDGLARVRHARALLRGRRRAQGERPRRRWARASSSSSRPSTPGASASRRSRSASPKARTRRR